MNGGREALLASLLDGKAELTLYRGTGVHEFGMTTGTFAKLNSGEQTRAINKVLGGQMQGLFFTPDLRAAKDFAGQQGVVVKLILTRDELMRFAREDSLYIGMEGDEPYVEVNLSDEALLRSIFLGQRYTKID
jgi:hypothetical protein